MNYFRVTGVVPTVTLLLGTRTPVAADSNRMMDVVFCGWTKKDGKPY